MKLDLSGRSALVTGGSRGIGRAICAALADSGARVTLGYRRDTAAAREVVASIRDRGGEAHAVRADLGRREAAARLVQAATKRFGAPQLVINNAGIWTAAAIERMPDATLEETLNLNLAATFRVIRASVPAMKRHRFGRIVNISSTAGQRGEAGHSHYAASKGGVIALTKSLSTELAGSGITVNAVAPGWVDTDMCSSTFRGAGRRRITSTIPLGRVGRPEEIAGPVVFLCSDLASFVTGEILNVNGGAVLCG